MGTGPDAKDPAGAFPGCLPDQGPAQLCACSLKCVGVSSGGTTNFLPTRRKFPGRFFCNRDVGSKFLAVVMRVLPFGASHWNTGMGKFASDIEVNLLISSFV